MNLEDVEWMLVVSISVCLEIYVKFTIYRMVMYYDMLSANEPHARWCVCRVVGV